MTLWSRKSSSHQQTLPAEALPGTRPTQQGSKSLPPPGTEPTQLKEAVPGCFIEHFPATGLNTQLHADLGYFEYKEHKPTFAGRKSDLKDKKTFTVKPNRKENLHIRTI